jgi:hypothetical protein
MRHDRETLTRLATNRQKRIQANGRPAFALTTREIERSTRTAMQLTDASRHKREARPGLD